jgi:proteic killer suppression protein
MIKTFANKETAAVFANERVRRFGEEWLQVARRKLAQLNRVETVEELRIPPGNRLQKLSGGREGQWSIRVNDQWRICFIWLDGHAWEVEIVDYH